MNETGFHSILLTGGGNKSRLREAVTLSCQILEREAPPPATELNEERLLGVLGYDSFILGSSEGQTITIEAVRVMKEKIQVRPTQGFLRVVLILEAQNLTVAAQNALLKTLEEPPSQSVLILTAKNPALLLPTLVSRCSRKEIGEEPVTQTDLSFLTFKTVCRTKRPDRLDWSEDHKKNLKPAAVEQIIDLWVSEIRDLLIDRQRASTKEDKGLIQFIDELLEEKRKLGLPGLNARLLFENLLLKIPELTRDCPSPS